ncbi:MAG: formylglycine-generating enzyme family protein [Bacteroidia bacterium]|nr:formylglycine-generating enzyme family protein [Bacteroidia bacterium]
MPKTIEFHLKDQTFEMVFVAGTDENGFMMGGESGYNDSLPVHAVRLSSYWIGKYPVTQGLYEAVMGASAPLSNPSRSLSGAEGNILNPSQFQGDENRPVENVSWEDIMVSAKNENGEVRECFMDKLNALILSDAENRKKMEAMAKEMKKEKIKFTLPSEAQWEYAAKGGKEEWRKDYLYSGSNELQEVAWYRENSHNETKPVGLKKPNSLGLYDMSGNVWEWCMDYYDSEYYKRSKVHPPLLNPVNLAPGSHRVRRGGSWDNGRGFVRLPNRFNDSPAFRINLLGFRFCLA